MYRQGDAELTEMRWPGSGWGAVGARHRDRWASTAPAEGPGQLGRKIRSPLTVWPRTNFWVENLWEKLVRRASWTTHNLSIQWCDFLAAMTILSLKSNLRAHTGASEPRAPRDSR